MKGVLIDVTRCTGCSVCIEACCQAHGYETMPQRSRYDSQDGLSAQRYATIIKSIPKNGEPARFVRKSCMHCIEPACVSVCPVGAMERSELGPVRYHPEICMGCRYCMMACPYGIPRYEWDSAAPEVRKCDLCYDRIVEGQLPACVEACPHDVLTFGNRADLILQAHHQIFSEPGKYLSEVYGEHEVGGTSILYISDVPLDVLGMHSDPGKHPRPALSAAWLNKVPALSLASAGLMTGLFYIIGRRMSAEELRLQNEKSG